MSHTNSTTNYNLPQFLTTDKPAWLTDVNNAYFAIDAQMKLNADAASTADGKATQAGTDASAADTKATTAKNEADGALASIAKPFSATDTYLVNDLVIYNSLLYKCTVAVTTPGPWTGSTNWTRITVEDAIDTVKNDLGDLATTVTTNTNAITGLTNEFSGFHFSSAALETNTDVYSPSFTTMCIAFIGRHRAGIYIGSGDDVQTVVQCPNMSVYKINTQLRLTNTGTTTSIVTFIYK